MLPSSRHATPATRRPIVIRHALAARTPVAARYAPAAARASVGVRYTPSACHPHRKQPSTLDSSAYRFNWRESRAAPSS